MTDLPRFARIFVAIGAAPMLQCIDDAKRPDVEDAPRDVGNSRKDGASDDPPEETFDAAFPVTCDVIGSWDLEFEGERGQYLFPARLEIAGTPGMESTTFLDRPQDCESCGPMSIFSLDRETCTISIVGDSHPGGFDLPECVHLEHNEFSLRFPGGDTRRGSGTVLQYRESVCGARDLGLDSWDVTATRIEPAAVR